MRRQCVKATNQWAQRVDGWPYSLAGWPHFVASLGWLNSGTNLVSIVLVPFDLLIVLAQVCSCLEFDLTLGVIHSFYVASICSLNFSKLYCV
jgi:hypothetical protein